MTARVLVVDDLQPNIKLLEAKLNSEYYDVITAINGIQAVEKSKEFMPDIVLLDVMMPEMDGFEACKKIKSDEATSHIPVVMVTALSEVEDRVKGLEAGADDFITKPINDNALFARIRSLVRLKNITDELRLRKQTDSSLGLFEGDMFSDNIILDNSNILIVDDDVVQTKNLAEHLTKINQKSNIITDPNAAINDVNHNNYDLIIVSTQLTDYDGLRLCVQLRNNDNTRNIPILIIIEEDDTKTLVKGFEIGVNDYIVNPFDYNELTARIKTQIRKKRYQDLLKENFQKSVSLAMTDGLTGCYNRRYLDTYLSNKLIDSDNISSLSIIMLDIDHFKNINDTYGHQVGDDVLKQVAEIINNNVRATDLVSRYGGEEFLVVLPDANQPFNIQIAERVRAKVEECEIKSEGHVIKCTISLGLSEFKKGDTAEMLISKADKLLYQAKDNGRNKLIYSD